MSRISVHDHTRARQSRLLIVVLAISLTFFFAEVVGGVISNSLALLADAGHLLTDILAIGVALIAFRLARWKGGDQRTYGFARAEIMAGLLNGLSLVLVAAYAGFEGARRIASTPDVQGGTVLWVGLAGLAANVVAALLLHRGSRENLNVRSVFLHVMGDGLGSIGVVTSALIIMFTGWNLVDPIVGVFIGVLILFAAGRLIVSTVNVLMEAAPNGVRLAEVRNSLLDCRGIESVHDLHVWTLTSGCVAMSAHVRASPDVDRKSVLLELREKLKARYGINHLTVQLEDADLPDEDVHLEGDPRCLA